MYVGSRQIIEYIRAVERPEIRSQRGFPVVEDEIEQNEEAATELWPAMTVGQYVICAIIGFVIAVVVYWR